MKAIVKSGMVVIFFLAASLAFFAQVAPEKGDRNNRQPQAVGMMPGTNMSLHFSDKDQVDINPETEYPVVVKRFRKLFPGATKEAWYKEENSLFVYFFHWGNKMTAVFNLQGSLNYAIANLEIADLPGRFIDKIERLYKGYGFFNVKQIMRADCSAYEIVLVNLCEYVIINVTEEEITEQRRVRKI